MCQMRIVLKQGDTEELVLENAAQLKVTDTGILINALFEQPKLIQGAMISGFDFLENKVTLIKTSGKA
ncbi:MAG: CooT family nickel-binding protein [bacterium]